MKTLPDNVEPYKKTPTFSEVTVPDKLRSAHFTKSGVWGKIVVVEGELLYRILEPQPEEIVLSKNRFGVVEPQIRHEVEPIGSVQFYVEFHR